MRLLALQPIFLSAPSSFHCLATDTTDSSLPSEHKDPLCQPPCALLLIAYPAGTLVCTLIGSFQNNHYDYSLLLI